MDNHEHDVVPVGSIFNGLRTPRIKAFMDKGESVDITYRELNDEIVTDPHCLLASITEPVVGSFAPAIVEYVCMGGTRKRVETSRILQVSPAEIYLSGFVGSVSGQFSAFGSGVVHNHAQPGSFGSVMQQALKSGQQGTPQNLNNISIGGHVSGKSKSIWKRAMHAVSGVIK